MATYMQLLVQITWVGLQLKGQPPKPKPISVPAYEREPTVEEIKRAERHRHAVENLRRYSPTYQPASAADA